MTTRVARALPAATRFEFIHGAPRVACDGQNSAITSDAGYVGCSGAWVGDNSHQSADIASQPQGDSGLSGLTPTDVTGGNGNAVSGVLSVGDQLRLLVISLKADNAFSLYESDGSTVAGDITEIVFDTLGVGFFSSPDNKAERFGQGLSHADRYAPSASVPEPATLALLGRGIAGLGLARRRRAP